MQTLHNAIVLIGFKHVGKSVIGQHLAKKLQVPWVDLDQKIEALHATQLREQCTCRQIMQNKGEHYFRLLEKKALLHAVKLKPSILSLGGSTPMSAANKRIIKSCIIVHITALQGTVFERIRMSGRPAFFNLNENLWESFNRLWHQRIPIYEAIKDFSIENSNSVDDAVKKITCTLNLREIA